jgi:hypothetical protein
MDQYRAGNRAMSISNPTRPSNQGQGLLDGLAAGRSGLSSAASAVDRVYRLVDRQGNPHPVLDDLYDSLDAAWNEALSWWGEQRGEAAPVEIGVEVSTTSGSWRTLRHPAG